MTEYYQSRVYDLAGHDPADFEKACAKAREWDYNRDAPIALGVFYERALPTFDDRYRSGSSPLRNARAGSVTFLRHRGNDYPGTVTGRIFPWKEIP